MSNLRKRRTAHLYFIFIISIILFSPSFIYSQPVTLVDFGTSEGNNTFALTGWNQTIAAPEMIYSDAGPGGLAFGLGFEEFTDFMGVKGSPRQFVMGERIVVTWYNNSDETIYFSGRISFSDENTPSINSPDGKWYTMRSFSDYRNTYAEIQPHSPAKTVFNITDTGVHKTNEIYSLVNINLHIEYYDTYNKQFLICDKIELWNDADITPPGKPTELAAGSVTDSRIPLQWNYPTDDVEVVEYIVYQNGVPEGYTQVPNYTVVYLEPNTEYTFTVTALDMVGNESFPSDPLTVSTRTFRGGSELINPEGFEYLGAFAVTEDFAYGGEAIAFNPNGNGGAGSLFISDLNQPQQGFVGEVTIPAPVLSPLKNIGDLNNATIIQAPVNIRPSNVNNWGYVDIWYTGLEYIEEENRLYSSWAIYYDVNQDKTASISCVDASNLAGGTKHGAWFLGSSNPSILPIDSYLNDYLFRVPSEWANEHLNGRELINGRYREGGLSGLGPTLYAVDLIGGGTIPAADAEFDFYTLLQYGTVEGTDNYNYPNSIDDYNHADWWKEAEWISADNQAAVAIIGNHAMGHNYYGYNGERMRHDWVIADLPYPEFAETDPNGKGWKAYNMLPMIIFYDPSDLAGVATGVIESYQPQPYAALRMDRNIFWGPNTELRSASYDENNNRLYVTEFNAPGDGLLMIHVWEVSHIVSVDDEQTEILNNYKLEHNYPNPFNPSTVICYQIAEENHVSLKVCDIIGSEVAILVDEQKPAGYYKVEFNGADLASGIYLYTFQAGKFTDTKKLVIIK